MTWEFAFSAVTALFLVYYAVFVLSARHGLLSLRLPKPSSFQPSVSVIIAARNEQATIADCLKSVLDQDYQRELVEVVLVDDGSTDEQPIIVAAIASRDKRLKVLPMANEKDISSPRKPQALAKGIQASRGEIILTTDGDCLVPRTWISSMVRTFDDDTAFVAGPVKELPTSSLVSRLSQLEFLALVGISAGLISNETPIICNGANIAFRRKSFEAANGYGDKGFCDDEVLMHRIKTRNLGKVHYSIDKDSIVSTNAPATVYAFWNQRTRWASKRGHYEDTFILVKLVALYISFVLLLTFCFSSVLVPRLFPLAAAYLVLKAALDYTMLRTAARRFDLDIRMGDFFIAQIFHVPYIVAAAFAGQFSSPEWKGKPIRT